MIALVDSPIDRDAVAAAVAASTSGALVIFEGVVRDTARGKRVTHLVYESYGPMALKQLSRLQDAARERWPEVSIAVVHRTGRLEIGESSVVIAVSAPHRAEAFDACRFLIDQLKTSVPIWKKEFYDDGESWIEGYGGG